MRKVPDWLEWLLAIATTVSTRSKDPNTQVGCVIANGDNDIIATGYNGFAPSALDNSELWERPTKYTHVIHAETNAIARAAKLGHSVNRASLYTTHFPCVDCTKLIIASGITEVFATRQIPNWEESHEKAKMLMDNAGVTYLISTTKDS